MLAKRLFYLSENRLSAWRWRGGELSCSGVFNADKEGLANFSEHLVQAPNTPIYFLVDVIEEEFHNETIPHIFGKDRRALISSKLNRLLRTAACRHACTQGRESGGRRDDKLLLTGLSNDDLLKPWVERILLPKQPLAGIWSLPLLSQVLVNKLGLVAPHQLLVTRQAATGLRQSYFQQGQIKFSRLTLLSADNFASMRETISRETARTQQYLNSLHLLPGDAVLDIAICGANHLRLPQAESMNAPLLRYQVFSLEDILGRLGFKAPAIGLTSEILYLHLLGRYAPPQHYATPEQLRYHRLRQVRTGILGATTLLLVVAGYVAGQNFDQALDDYRESEKISRETHGYFSQYQAIKKTFLPTPATPENMKGSVELMQAVYDQDVMPERLMVLISRALESSSSLKLNRIKWQVSDRPDGERPLAEKNALPPAGDVAESHAPDIVIGAGKPYQIAILDGEISPFSDYRSALGDVNRFVETLNNIPSLRAAVLSMPIDVSSFANLQGGMGSAQEKPAFSLRLVLSPAP